MKLTEQNPLNEFNKIALCINVSLAEGKIFDDDAESLTFFLELIQEALEKRRQENA